MGKGDRKTRKGKIAIRSYGNSRPHADQAAAAKTGTAKPATRAAAKPAVKKAAPVRKAAPKKTA
jgi:ribosomal small subunit protein bTHX